MARAITCVVCKRVAMVEIPEGWALANPPCAVWRRFGRTEVFSLAYCEDCAAVIFSVNLMQTCLPTGKWV